MVETQYPHKCPVCGSAAFIGLAKIDCSNPTCTTHPCREEGCPLPDPPPPAPAPAAPEPTSAMTISWDPSSDMDLSHYTIYSLDPVPTPIAWCGSLISTTKVFVRLGARLEVRPVDHRGNEGKPLRHWTGGPLPTPSRRWPAIQKEVAEREGLCCLSSKPFSLSGAGVLLELLGLSTKASFDEAEARINQLKAGKE